jgi:D-alanine-D-alanine ligase
MLIPQLTPEENARLKIWVLAPSLITNDPNIDYYYDFSQSIQEYTKVFATLKMHWQWQPVTMEDYASIISAILKEKQSGEYFPIVLNLCDGDEINGTPGISVVRLLDSYELLYTGSDEYFYTITTSKIPMKRAFDDAGIATAKWKAIYTTHDADASLFDALGSPLIVM